MCTHCGEEYDTSYTFWEDVVLSLGNKENKLKKKLLYVPNKLRQEHWSILLKFAKNSKRF